MAQLVVFILSVLLQYLFTLTSLSIMQFMLGLSFQFKKTNLDLISTAKYYVLCVQTFFTIHPITVIDGSLFDIIVQLNFNKLNYKVNIISGEAIRPLSSLRFHFLNFSFLLIYFDVLNLLILRFSLFFCISNTTLSYFEIFILPAIGYREYHLEFHSLVL